MGVREWERKTEKKRRNGESTGGTKRAQPKWLGESSCGERKPTPGRGEVLGSRMGEENWAGGGAQVLSETGPGTWLKESWAAVCRQPACPGTQRVSLISLFSSCSCWHLLLLGFPFHFALPGSWQDGGTMAISVMVTFKYDLMWENRRNVWILGHISPRWAFLAHSCKCRVLRSWVT